MRFNEAEAITPRNHEVHLIDITEGQVSASMRPRQSRLGIPPLSNPL